MQTFSLFLVSRNCAARKNVATLIFGVFVGFSFAFLFVVSPPRDYWTSEPKVELRDPHYGHDLADAAGPLLDVG